MTDQWDKVEIASAQALHDWLEAHHLQDESVLLVTYKKADKARYVSRDEVLDALLSYGWIDGRRYALDEGRTMQLICRRQQKAWTQSYRARAERLIKEGAMTPHGMAAINDAKAHGTRLAGQEIDDHTLPDDLKAALISQGGEEWWQDAAPSYRRNLLRWLALAKRTTTRDKRIDAIAKACAAGQKIPNF